MIGVIGPPLSRRQIRFGAATLSLIGPGLVSAWTTTLLREGTLNLFARFVITRLASPAVNPRPAKGWCHIGGGLPLFLPCGP